ncbi:23S rRNA (guanosine2251-2'-O)-methyltransferase [Mycoplasmopsis agassizii]|uniref:23S rRNA (Guanosine(2251)-2'-O)-methyltransferase RlmB n=1 Tax=Mycoplasmopsis agassizii TaxID=33922 RepID=A0ABX4H473_9BACT|nr:23S rRNA (guanosine(2251)-2'-O)-methyltransferase RlmB [Mycoplasmopsis agassizii]SMC16020.1 23S rRNA (guanosine2251-2'-O)-methyltransferase [Mycoplasmopsis agassizii]
MILLNRAKKVTNNKLFLTGKNSIYEAIKFNFKIEKIYLEKGKKLDLETDIKITYLDKYEMNKLTKTNHQGYIAQISDFNYLTIEELIKTQEPIIVLDHLEDPQNFGAIIRSANSFGIKNIVFAKERSVQITDTVLKASSGGFINMKFHKASSLTTTIQKLKKAGYWIYASHLSEKTVDLKAVDFDSKSVIIIGNEHKGVNNSLVKESDLLFKIPSFGTVQSLNASAASAIIFYDLKLKIEAKKVV